MKKIKEWAMVLAGSLITGFGIACFGTPAKIAAGGANGMAIIIHYLLGLDPGLVSLMINIPLLIIGVKVFGKRYGFKTVLGSITLSLSITFWGKLNGYQGFFPYADKMDVLLSALCAGVLVGSGIGIVMRAEANTGGTDIIAQILYRYTPISLGAWFLVIDGMVIVAGGFVFGIERAIFGVIQLAVTSFCINYMVIKVGTQYAKTAYIVSDRYHEIGERIVKELHHGGTVIYGEGLFTGKTRRTLMTVVHNQHIPHLMTIVQEEDSAAFVFVNETYQVSGLGFGPRKVKKL